MSQVAIVVEGLGKRYGIGEREPYHALRDILTNALAAPFRKAQAESQPGSRDPESEYVWALKDVSFEVRAGEVMGIVGRNGAGKSTLLKVLSRITRPTEGCVETHGRVGALLEVGTGFHPELTGRENIYLSGAILGMKKAEIDRKFDEIVAFAEIERFIDTPVKRYSSGMYTRIAFAVAAHLEPEILVVDEVLAVGDAAFQRKCLGKMGDVAKQGRTILFVSHNMNAIQRLCRRAVWLDEGRILSQGRTDSVVSEYLRRGAESCTERIWPDLEAAPGNESVRLHSVRLATIDGTPADAITSRTPFALEFLYWNLKPDARLNLSLALHNQEGICVFTTTTVGESNWHGRPFPSALYRSVCHVPANLLNEGTYRAVLLMVQDLALVLHCYEDVLVFEVRDSLEDRGEWYGKWIGVVRPRLRWTTELVGPVKANAAAAHDGRRMEVP